MLFHSPTAGERTVLWKTPVATILYLVFAEDFKSEMSSWLREKVWFGSDLHWCNTCYLTHKLKFCQYDNPLPPLARYAHLKIMRFLQHAMIAGKINWGTKCSTAEGETFVMLELSISNVPSIPKKQFGRSSNTTQLLLYVSEIRINKLTS